MSNHSYKFTANFERISPAAFTEKVGLPLGWFIVHYSHVPDKAARRRAHGAWFEIRSDRGTVYRMLRFAGNLKKGTGELPGQIVLDWPGWIDLHNRDEDVDKALELTVNRVSWWKLPWAYLGHPDPAVRLSGWLGWTSIMLGILSLVISLT